MGTRILSHAFSGGEITPELFGRLDVSKVQEGLALCQNFITLPHGPAINRPGTEYVRAVKNPAAVTRIIPFSFNNTQTFAIELGAGYFRFHTNGATLESAPGVPYEVANSYAAADLMDIHYTQSADVLTLVHPNYAPAELRRLGALSWTLVNPTYNPPANSLTALTATPTGAGVTTYSYVVTCIQASDQQESVQYATPATCANDLTVAGNKNTVAWTDGAAGGTNVRYNVYRLSNGIYGYVGQAGASPFIDDNIAPDISQTPPMFTTVFASAGNYPAAVGYHQQRRCFGGTTSQPQNVWMTRSGTESNMGYTIPTRDDNRIAFRIAAREASAIRHIVPVQTLLLLSASTEWQVSSSTDAITPTTLSVRPQSYVGANNVQPVVVNNIVLFAASRGGHLREMSYSWQASGYTTGDVSLFAPHLFDYNSIVDMAYCRSPIPILWCVSSTGKLLGMTYVPEQQIAAWHQHTTGTADAFESVCAITEGNDDVLYCIVRRTINGVTARFVERMHSRNYPTLADSFFVDCGATYSGAPVTTISGLTWLNGATVNILADGAVVPPQVVTGGAITLPVAASKVIVGLPITSRIQTPPAAAQVDPGMAQGRPKNINRVWLRVQRSSGVYVGQDFNSLTPYAQRTAEPYGAPPALVSDEIEVVPTAGWSTSGQLCVQQTDPLPLDVVSATVEMAIGGGI